jgi:mono/diheme cytochrome c family protein
MRGRFPAVAVVFLHVVFSNRWGAPGRLTASPGAEDAYLKKCAVCHHADGSGQTARGKKLKLRDLRSPEVQKLSDAQLFDIIAKGMGKDMPGYEKTMGVNGVREQVSYMRELARKKK